MGREERVSRGEKDEGRGRVKRLKFGVSDSGFVMLWFALVGFVSQDEYLFYAQLLIWFS